jgi:wyosine [tRNA(Phe)-imidazoG37] synthetase (radical SAM superfamily)
LKRRAFPPNVLTAAKALPEKQKPGTFSHLYGPVASRRLGFSLGVDILPYKTCSFDCVYCQLGRTPRKSRRRRKFFSSRDILPQIKKALASGRQVDYITFSGSGEPTLNLEIGNLIRQIKKITSVPVAVLTNSSLLSRKSVRQALLAADLVVPSLDAARAGAFRKVNRPDPDFQLENIIRGLEKFRQEFKGQVWLEVMLVKGINDSPSDINTLKEAIARIKPDKVQLNTVVRPPAEKWAHPLSKSELEAVKDRLGGQAEVVVDFKAKSQPTSPENLEEAVLSIIRRRPVNLKDLAEVLAKDKRTIRRSLDALAAKGKIRLLRHPRAIYYGSR